ncbi:thiamine phosphate synthase [Paenibacillus taiwanensis]|uniref:thiamine phosphate synthase n=1 Tax=Paenibacillus taiwanensis TaxID=401638 RepID=UPI000403C865|nr:thiamine phosphate synthase [Paenibacillus taiwanensis]
MIVPWLHIVTPEGLSGNDIVQTVKIIAHKVDAVHLRQKQWSARQMWSVLEEARLEGIPMHKWIVNDRADVAASCGARGVHLAYHSVPIHAIRPVYPQLTVGVSVHSPMELTSCVMGGADYALYGHIYETACKPGLAGRGLQGLMSCRQLSAIPIIAIGGITPERVSSVIQAGASGVAVMSPIWETSSPLNMVLRYRDAMHALVP